MAHQIPHLPSEITLMRPHSMKFRLSATVAVAGLMLAQLARGPALAQPAPPPGVVPAQPDQQTADPPARVGRLAQVTGTVSYHGSGADQWTLASMNYPVATGDA